MSNNTPPRQPTFPLRLPLSLRTAIEKLAAKEGTSINQFLVMAAAEKVSSIETAETFFAKRRKSGDIEKARAFLTRPNTQEPHEDDWL